MKWLMRFMSVTAIGLAAAFVLSQLPEWRDAGDGEAARSGGERARAAFALTDANLVDRIGALSLRTGLVKVNLHHSMLALELSLGDPAGGAGRIYGDLLALCRFSFEETDNIERLLVRVVDERGRLLMSMDSSREQWLEAQEEAEAAAEDDPGSAGWETLFRRHFSMTYTPAWQSGEEERLNDSGNMR